MTSPQVLQMHLLHENLLRTHPKSPHTSFISTLSPLLFTQLQNVRHAYSPPTIRLTPFFTFRSDAKVCFFAGGLAPAGL